MMRTHRKLIDSSIELSFYKLYVLYSFVSIWNASNGKIVATIDTKMELIYQVEYKKEVCVIIGVIETKGVKAIVMKSYIIEPKVSFFPLFSRSLFLPIKQE